MMLDLSLDEIRAALIMCNYALSSTAGGVAPEEESLIAKLRAALDNGREPQLGSKS